MVGFLLMTVLAIFQANSVNAMDVCGDPRNVPSLPFTDTKSTDAVTTDPTDPVPPCGNGSRGRSVWYTFTATFDGGVAADTFESSYDTILSVYTGECGSLQPVPGACNDDALTAISDSEVRFAVTTGTMYRLLVTAFNSDGGALTFHMRQTNAPANDACDAPVVITTDTFTTSLATLDATTADSDPMQSCAFDGADQNLSSVWYSFTAPANGSVTATTLGSDYDTVLTAFTGNCASLTEIACNDDVVFPSTTTSQVTFAVTAGTTYLLEPTHYHLAFEGSMLQFAVTFSASTSPTPTATVPSGGECLGDCDSGGSVTVDEIVTGVNIALGTRAIADCPSFDGDGSDSVTVDELIQAIQNALEGC